MNSYMFFLGGHDLEMQSIRALLEARQGQNVEFCDKGLGWGAKASSYKSEIQQAKNLGKVPVLVELELDIPVSASVIIDHHGDQFANKASLLQVMDLLGIQPSRHDQLVAANDSGYIPAMIAMGASTEEIENIRLLDRKAQGVTEQMENDAERAITHSRLVNGIRIVRLPHTKCSPVTDRLFTTWPGGKENLLVIGMNDGADIPFEVNYFGHGDVCKALKETFSGWGGGKGYGNPDGSGFAGCKTTLDELSRVVDFVTNHPRFPKT